MSNRSAWTCTAPALPSPRVALVISPPSRTVRSSRAMIFTVPPWPLEPTSVELAIIPSISTRSALTVICPALPWAKVPLVICAPSCRFSVPVVTCTLPALPLEPDWAEVLMMLGLPVARSVPLISTRSALTVICPALPWVEVALPICAPSCRFSVSVVICILPAVPLEPTSAELVMMLGLPVVGLVPSISTRSALTVICPALPWAKVELPICPPSCRFNVPVVTCTSPAAPLDPSLALLAMRPPSRTVRSSRAMISTIPP